MNRRINTFLLKHGQMMMWLSGACALAGILLQRAIPEQALSAALFTAGTLLAGLPIAFRAISGLKYKTIGIELLVTIAVTGAFCIREYSEAAIVTFLFQFGSWLEQKTAKKTRSAIKSLMEMAPTTAWIEDEAGLREVDADEVCPGDTLLLKTGAKVPVDGVILSGECHIDEASITGESSPRAKAVGEQVYAGTVLVSGMARMRAAKVGEDTTFAKIIALVEEAQDAKSPEERLIDRFAKVYTPAVIVMAALVFLILRDADAAITVLVLACPGALVVGAPIANVAGIGRGAREGVLLKGGQSIHDFAGTDIMAFDKTGTLTQGHPQVIHARFLCGADEENAALALVASAELGSDHPLAQAVVECARARELALTAPEKVDARNGLGVASAVNGRQVLVGNERLMESCGIHLDGTVITELERCAAMSGSCVLAAIDGRICAVFVIRDKVRSDARENLARLKKKGIRRLVMLTGDNAASAGAIARELNLDEVYAGLLPEDKLKWVRKMQAEGHRVTFVGDGINDSPALTAADTGIAMGSGTDIAIDSSDVVLIKSDLESVALAYSLARKTAATLRQNVLIAIVTVLLLLAGLFAGVVHMSVGMLVHEASILAVILNAMRLLLRRL